MSIEDLLDMVADGIGLEPYLGRNNAVIDEANAALAVVRVSAVDCKQLIRALTAQAWAVACAVQDVIEHAIERNTREHGWLWNERARGLIAVETALASLPAPADLTAQLLGDG